MIRKTNIIDSRIDKVASVFIRKSETDWKTFFFRNKYRYFFFKKCLLQYHSQVKVTVYGFPDVKAH